MVTADRGFGARRAIQSDPLPAHDSAVRHVHMRRLDGRHDSAERRARQAYGLRQAGALIALGMDNAECKLYAARMDMTEAVAAPCAQKWPHVASPTVNSPRGRAFRNELWRVC